METISLKLDATMLRHMDTTLKKHDFSTRTEFIRDAIREKLASLQRDDLLRQFLQTAGSARRTVDDAELQVIREDVLAKLAKKKGWD